MIPALICPAYNRHDLLDRMLASIDVPVERGLLVDNGMSYMRRNLSEEDGVLEMLHVKHWRPPFASIGYGGAINFGITQMADAPWWLWASNDVQFLPGHLATVVSRMNNLPGPAIITGSFTWAAINRHMVDLVGLIDDWSFFPIYFDDNDYHIRVARAGATWIEDGFTGILHGEGDGGSMTIRSDEVARQRNHGSFEENKARYIAKWGGMPGSEVYKTPWNQHLPLWATKPDIAGRAGRQW